MQASYYSLLTLILLEQKVISLCHQHRNQANIIYMQISIVWPGSILLAGQLQVIILISLKMIMNISENGKLIIPFMKFSRLNVNRSLNWVSHCYSYWKRPFKILWNSAILIIYNNNEYIWHTCDFFSSSPLPSLPMLSVSAAL